ncbi:GlxA family transcriptional regulator [Pseudodonghicola flavimaris]|uniref:GlxA family transcriptional regulator n=1 Tax=Pseudodonghicola flavimaris TaxID=3050036 RepID=A0ABT7F6F3_9RHOB|nr:GlxA family transcriptional regulator [Pseudodonghicola flavimaris]MDK3020191.1 GlxA family transcriptional regulator [Pseudodonghicola flavimaris]
MFYTAIDEPLRFAFLMVEDMSFMSLASATEPLRAANRLLGREAYVWDFCSPEGEAVRASNGVVFPAGRVDMDRAHAVILCGGGRVPPELERPYLAVLRRAARRGLAVGSLSTATHLLARAGLLDGYRCTIHWENRSAFEEDFPEIEISSALYEIDRSRLTCSGGTASMDMMLHIISDRDSVDLARAVANQFHHERIRASSEDQQGGRLQQIGALPQPMQRVIRAMQENMETPLGVEDLARIAGLSARQLERQFGAHLDISPARFYLSLRLERARELLIYTDQPVINIAVAVGFTSASHLSKRFREFFQMRPTDVRKRAQLRRQPEAEQLRIPVSLQRPEPAEADRIGRIGI